jgi:monofunctional biosynthetic peptidoglycan transglycosylase
MAGLLLSIIAFRFINPPVTSVMIAEKLKGATLKHRWVPLDAMARHLPLAVIASEDGRFCLHWGVDWGAVKDAVEEAKRRHRGFRGASTITMQTAKNLYLFTDRSYVRKVLEVPLAYLLTLLWPKERVIEVYLNIAQWGRASSAQRRRASNIFQERGGATRRRLLLARAAEPAYAIREAEPQNAQDFKSVERRTPIRHAPLQAVPQSRQSALASAVVSYYNGAHSRTSAAGNFKGDYGCTKEKTSRMKGQPPLPRRPLRADLCRGQGPGRAPSVASYRSQVRQHRCVLRHGEEAGTRRPGTSLVRGTYADRGAGGKSSFATTGGRAGWPFRCLPSWSWPMSPLLRRRRFCADLIHRGDAAGWGGKSRLPMLAFFVLSSRS